MKRIAIIVGHSPNAKGAVNFMNVSEYDFNKAVAEKILLDLVEYDCNAKMFLRLHGISNLGAEVKVFDPAYSVELHFNSSEYAVTGAQTEVLCMPYVNGIAAAQKLAAAFEKEYKYGLRNGKDMGAKILNPESRGWGNLHSTGKKDALLIEPVFGNTATSQAKDFFKNPDRYSKFLSDYIVKELGLVAKDVPPVLRKVASTDEIHLAINNLVAALENYRNG